MADAQARRYSNMGHLKGMVDRLEAQVAEHVSELVKYKLENQDLKETAANIKKDNEMLESEILSSKQVHDGLLNMYEAANRQNQIKDNLIQSQASELTALRELLSQKPFNPEDPQPSKDASMLIETTVSELQSKL